MRGAVLEVCDGMKPVACTIDDTLAVKPRNRAQLRVGNSPLGVKKSPRRVLVVDDEPLIRWSVSESLADVGYDVEQASDAASALRAVTTTLLPFDTVVLDLRLPDMDDLSLLATMRQLVPATTMVLMTAFGTPEIMAEASALGAGVIHKPFELDDLTRMVRGPKADRT
jgi:DNA-binding NtrC family response regulator